MPKQYRCIFAHCAMDISHFFFCRSNDSASKTIFRSSLATEPQNDGALEPLPQFPTECSIADSLFTTIAHLAQVDGLPCEMLIVRGYKVTNTDPNKDGTNEAMSLLASVLEHLGDIGGERQPIAPLSKDEIATLQLSRSQLKAFEVTLFQMETSKLIVPFLKITRIVRFCFPTKKIQQPPIVLNDHRLSMLLSTVAATRKQFQEVRHPQTILIT
jgi:hypothetical protein